MRPALPSTPSFSLKPEESLTVSIHVPQRIICRIEEKMFHFILIVGFLCFSLGESTTTDAPTTTELTTETTESTTMTSAPSTQQPDPSIITGLRIAVKSFIDLNSDRPEMELIVRQIEGFIPYQHRATTSITVRKIQRGF